MYFKTKQVLLLQRLQEMPVKLDLVSINRQIQGAILSYLMNSKEMPERVMFGLIRKLLQSWHLAKKATMYCYMNLHMLLGCNIL
jgi:hypothetical protein